MFERNCPGCGRIIKYSSKSGYLHAEKKNQNAGIAWDGNLKILLELTLFRENIIPMNPNQSSVKKVSKILLYIKAMNLDVQ